ASRVRSSGKSCGTLERDVFQCFACHCRTAQCGLPVAATHNRAAEKRTAEWADDNKVRKMNKSPKERVRATLEDAKDLAWEAFDAPSDEAVMCLFRRLCDIEDMCELDDMPALVCAGKPAEPDEDAPEPASH